MVLILFNLFFIASQSSFDNRESFDHDSPVQSETHPHPRCPLINVKVAPRCIDNVRIIPYYHTLQTEGRTMSTIHEIATITSKGQITLPKSIRQALGVSLSGKVA